MKPETPCDEAYWSSNDMKEWRGECQRGFVRDARFGEDQRVIKGTNRQKTKTAYSRFGGASGTAGGKL